MSESTSELENLVRAAKERVAELVLELDAAGDAAGDAGERVHTALDEANAKLLAAQAALERAQVTP